MLKKLRRNVKIVKGGYYHGDDYIHYKDGNLAGPPSSSNKSVSKKSFFESENYKKARNKQKKIRQYRERNSSTMKKTDIMVLPKICGICDNVYDKYEYEKCPYCYDTCPKCGKSYKRKTYDSCPHCSQTQSNAKHYAPQFQKVAENVFVKCPKCGRQYNKNIYSKCPTCNKNNYKSKSTNKKRYSDARTNNKWMTCPKCNNRYLKSKHGSCPVCKKSRVKKSKVNESTLSKPKVNTSNANKPKPIKPTNTVYMSNIIKCSGCGELYNKFKHGSCPNCGASNSYGGKSTISEDKVNSNNDSNWIHIVLAIIIAIIIMGIIIMQYFIF